MASSKISLREPYPPPSHPGTLTLPSELRLIWLRHPGYPDDSNMLFSFTAGDDDGIHHETARLACAVVAGNKWDGFLCEDKEGQQRVLAGPDECLRRPTYYFHLPSASDERYAVTPTFHHWNYPHNNLPKYWQNAEPSGMPAVTPRESSKSSCRMTQHEEAVENAHLVPAAQQLWFEMNQMAVYTKSTGIDRMKDPNNTIRFRKDIHTVFDAKRFTIVPKRGLLVGHTFNELNSEVFRLYHNVPMQPLKVSTSFLFARFAYTVFECLRTCLSVGRPRKLHLQTETGLVEKDCTGSECSEFARQTALQSKSRSASPKKWQRPEEVEDFALMEAEATDEENRRGRKRRRTGESWPSSTSFVNSSCSVDESVELAGGRSPLLAI